MPVQIWEVFGYIIIVVAIVLAVWELFLFRDPERDVWLVTPRRFHRRLMVSAVVVLIGLLIVFEATGFINLRQLPVLLVYLGAISSLAIILVILAIIDAGDTMRNASRQALDDLNKTIEEEQKRRASETHGSDTQE